MPWATNEIIELIADALRFEIPVTIDHPIEVAHNEQNRDCAADDVVRALNAAHYQIVRVDESP